MSLPWQTVQIWYVVSLLLWRSSPRLQSCGKLMLSTRTEQILFLQILFLVGKGNSFVLVSPVSELHLGVPGQAAVCEVWRAAGRRGLRLCAWHHPHVLHLVLWDLHLLHGPEEVQDEPLLPHHSEWRRLSLDVQSLAALPGTLQMSVVFSEHILGLVDKLRCPGELMWEGQISLCQECLRPEAPAERCKLQWIHILLKSVTAPNYNNVCNVHPLSLDEVLQLMMGMFYRQIKNFDPMIDEGQAKSSANLLKCQVFWGVLYWSLV